ncbi:sugar phosphate isomerase/epimerase family protein [Paenibacillus ginsengihumi]|jgi:3-dehydroshikimate dehydratase|uniref:sugar phosphate isomerase/epimerase family protein n=1 Tax=Paenibacillus ginsengihumi TaxID=431596 RepID=UPI000378EE0D|nr:sugar phosphate isomerase/epimerase [Paenibacillus ginsengihumi]
MIHTGLVSVTFRQLAAEEIIALVKKAGLSGIEWGGDIHVPHGDLERAGAVKEMTLKAGLKVAAYGSYYRLADRGPDTVPFDRVLETAICLGAPTIRVWAGNRGSAEADDNWREQVANDARTIAELAAKEGISISLEYHARTLTDTTESAYRLLRDIDHPNVRTLWQPPVGQSVSDNITSLQKVSPWLTNLHVYYWLERDRRPLSEGEGDWLRYLQEAAALPGDRYALLEFVKDDATSQFMEDAKHLTAMVAKCRASSV